jgi:hypothetical protein
MDGGKARTNGCAGGVHGVAQPTTLHKALDSSDLVGDRGRGGANLRMVLAKVSVIQNLE